MTSVLRLGHRPDRDKRMSTHICLTARALGAREVFFLERDPHIEDTVNKVTKRFGGNFRMRQESDWRGMVKNWSGDVIHLTMYGQDLDDFLNTHEVDDPLIIVGSQKVPREVYDISDHNVAVGSQPHSEVAALAIFMDRLNGYKIPSLSPGEVAVLPSEKGKRVIDYEKIPSADECYSLLVEAGADDDLISHTMAVLQRTLELHSVHGGDLRLLVAGALLHDIGRTITHGVEHALKGGEILSERGYHRSLIDIVERHIGGGITREEARGQGLPFKDYLPKTLEEKLVCHADNTAGGEERFNNLLDRTEGAGYHQSARRMRLLREELG